MTNSLTLMAHSLVQEARIVHLTRSVYSCILVPQLVHLACETCPDEYEYYQHIFIISQADCIQLRHESLHLVSWCGTELTLDLP